MPKMQKEILTRDKNKKKILEIKFNCKIKLIESVKTLCKCK